MKFLYLLLLIFPISATAQNFTLLTKADFVKVGNSSTLVFDADNDGKPDVLIMGKAGTLSYSKLYHNNGDSTFLDLGTNFPALAYGAAETIDFNNDGLMDIVICGFDGANRRFCLFKNRGNNLFSEISVNIPGVDYCDVKCADFNNDGFTDIIVCGQTATDKILKIYKNNGDATFTEAAALDGIFDGSIQVTDINHDGYPDIIASGESNNSELISRVYINKGKDFIFSQRTPTFTPIRGGKISLLDINNDGFCDVLISGKNSSDNYITEVYKNNFGETFTLSSTLKGLYYSTSAVGDFNNDGFSDIILSGLDATSAYQTVFYQNSGSGFIEIPTSLPDVYKGSISPIDVMGNGKLDVLITGYAMAGPVSAIYRNKTLFQNTTPGIPLSLNALANNDSVVLSWHRPQDAETPSKALTYDFYIKRVLDGDTIYTAPANYLTGNRNVTENGHLADTFIVIHNLPYGKYSWSVQSVDQNYAGSQFAVETQFNICHSLTIGRDTSVCLGNNFTLTAGNSTDIVDWYSADNSVTAFYRGNEATVTVSKKLKIWAIVYTSIGCTLSDTINLFTLPLPLTSLKRDTGVCINSNLSLSLADAGYLGDWTSKALSVSRSSISNVSFQILHDDTIHVKIKDLNGCINYDTLRLKAYALPVSFLPRETSSCLHTILPIKAGNDTDSVYWKDLSGELLSDKQTINFSVEKTSSLTVKLVSSLKCVGRDTILVKMLPLPATEAGRDTLICAGTSVKLGVDMQSEKSIYDWTPLQTLDNNKLANPIASPAITTKYYLKIADENACVNYDSVMISINLPSIIDAGGDKAICIGKDVKLGGNPTATGSTLPYSYHWFPEVHLWGSNIANPTANPDTSILYHLVVFAGECIVDTISVKVTVLSLPIITKSNDRTIGYTETAQLWAAGGTQYTWSPETGLDNSGISNPAAKPDATTTYSVLVTDGNGCESTAQVTITVRNEIFVPNLFTPNGDGKNDYFKVFGTGIGKINLRVYTPEGILVYETSDVNEATQIGWDGNFHGNPMNVGRYLWVIEAVSTDNKPLLYNNTNKGVITLLR